MASDVHDGPIIGRQHAAAYSSVNGVGHDRYVIPRADHFRCFGRLWHAAGVGLYQRTRRLWLVTLVGPIAYCHSLFSWHGYCHRFHRNPLVLSMFKSNLTALLSGIIFSFGLIVADMTNPSKVISFLDITGNWDPSLGLVMASAVLIGLVGHFIVQRSNNEIYHDYNRLCAVKTVDRDLVLGSCLFGIGWGLAGICPGPAVVGLAFANVKFVVFVLAMVGGMLIQQYFDSKPEVQA